MARNVLAAGAKTLAVSTIYRVGVGGCIWLSFSPRSKSLPVPLSPRTAHGACAHIHFRTLSARWRSGGDLARKSFAPARK
ncbi:unnamed protein product, partial [Iphiclides podalirius]